MKRGDLLRHIRRHGCYLKREGVPATIFVSGRWVEEDLSWAVCTCNRKVMSLARSNTALEWTGMNGRAPSGRRHAGCSAPNC